MAPIYIKKNNGDTQVFDSSKLKHSLVLAGASAVLVDEILAHIEPTLHDGMTTAEIYKKAFLFIHQKTKKPAVKYGLRRSLMTLGPTGFPFEKFLARVFQIKGYKTMVGATVRGKCVEHEVDVIAYNDESVLVMEAKFHNTLSIKTDTKVALYVKARFDDIKNEKIPLDNGQYRTPTAGILITNTEFTDSAEKYGTCENMGMISWDYPKTGNLYDLIEETGVHPITVLTSMTTAQKNELINNGVICCDQLVQAKELLDRIVQDPVEVDIILKEVNMII